MENKKKYKKKLTHTPAVILLPCAQVLVNSLEE